MKRIEAAIQRKVEDSLNSAAIKLEIHRQLEEGRKRLLVEVKAQLEREMEAALYEARQKEVVFWRKTSSRLLTSTIATAQILKISHFGYTALPSGRS